MDVSLLSEAARNARLERRKLKTKVKLDEEFLEEDGFDAKKYLKFVKKWTKKKSNQEVVRNSLLHK